MKLKAKQRKKLLAKARLRAGVCQCLPLRRLTGTDSAECVTCGHTLTINPKVAGSELVKLFLQCVSPTGDYCKHFIYWETNGVRVAHTLQGDKMETPTQCHCRKPPIVLERVLTNASPA